jgi:hypothetical protein
VAQAWQAWQVWRAEVEFADRFVAEAPDLDIVGARTHNGHADLLRERIDGRLGQ